jgi:hypothetical protein
MDELINIGVPARQYHLLRLTKILHKYDLKEFLVFNNQATMYRLVS